MRLDEARRRAGLLGVAGGHPGRQAAELMRRVERGDRLPDDWPAVVYALVQGSRTVADLQERWLIESLRRGSRDRAPMTWSSVAAVVDANLHSRQAAQAKWRRLVSDRRRVAGGPGRGGRPPATDVVAQAETRHDVEVDLGRARRSRDPSDDPRRWDEAFDVRQRHIP